MSVELIPCLSARVSQHHATHESSKRFNAAASPMPLGRDNTQFSGEGRAFLPSRTSSAAMVVRPRRLRATFL